MHLFSEGSINGIRLKTRIDRSATWEGMCNGEGSPSDRLIDFYRTSAKAASD